MHALVSEFKRKLSTGGGGGQSPQRSRRGRERAEGGEERLYNGRPKIQHDAAY